MSDETVKDDAPESPELGPDASKADLKAAADEILKAAKAAEPEAGADEHADADAPEEAQPLTPDQQILALEVEKQELRDQMLRAMAEMENLRRRTEREKQDMAKYAISNFARDILTVDDNMGRALAAVPEEAIEKDQALKALVDGIEMTGRELVNVAGEMLRLAHDDHLALGHHREALGLADDVVDVAIFAVEDGLVEPLFFFGEQMVCDMLGDQVDEVGFFAHQ